MSQLRCNSETGGAGNHLFLTEDLSDVVILVHHKDGNPWRFPVHSLMLSSQSVVFRRMLSSDFSEKNDHQIIIEDIKPHIVEKLIGYVYHGKVNFECWNHALDLLQAAHKYQIEPLVQNCARFLENVVSVSNVLYIYNYSYLYSLFQLKEKCLKLILDAAFLLLRKKAFEILSKEAVLDLVTNSCLNVDTELTVFEALLKWAPVQCCRMGLSVTEENILNVLEPFLKHVRFDDMSDTEKSALPPAVLSCVRPNNRNRISFCVPYSLLPYTYPVNFLSDLNCLAQIGDGLCCIRFSLDSSAYLIGFKFAVVTPEAIIHDYPFTLVKDSTEVGNNASINMFSIESSLRTEGIHMSDRQVFETQLCLRQPCHLEPKVVYKLNTLDIRQNSYCPKMIISERNKTIHTENEQIHISMHSENVWGVLGFIFI